MDKYLHLDTQAVRNEINGLMADYPELVEDESLRADMFEGSTGLHDILERALDERARAEEMVSGIKDRASSLAARKARFERKSEAIKKLMAGLMRIAELSKIDLPEATISITKGRQSVNIINVMDLPQGFYATERKPDRKAILAAMQAGEEIPGAELVTGDSGLTIRTK